MVNLAIGFITISALCGLIYCVLFLLDYSKRRSEHTVLEYQRAVFFRNGRPHHDVEPGVHKVLLGRDYIIFGDVRPIVVNIENHQVASRDGAIVRYSFLANAEVQTFRIALYSARNFSEIPYYILRRNVRAALFAQSREGLMGTCDVLAKGIEDRTRRDLNQVGFDLKDFRLGQLAVSDRAIRNSERDVAPPNFLN
jgi:SPFH domain / Band 7 family